MKWQLTRGGQRYLTGSRRRGLLARGIFYVCKRIPYNHAIWHGFVLAVVCATFWRSICILGRRNGLPL